MTKTEVLILGAGPAGLTAAIYLSRALVDNIILAGPQPGGQLTITTDVENYPGFIEPILGQDLMDRMLKQTEKYGSKVIYDSADSVDFKQKGSFIVNGLDGSYSAKSVIIATGASAKWLGLPSEQEFKGFGVSACATCDGFFFKNQDVIVIGGANSAVEEATYLAKLCKSVTIIYRGDKLRAEAILIERLKKLPNVSVIYNSLLQELKGLNNPKKLESAIILNNKTNKTTRLNIQGCFIAIGHNPNTNFLKDELSLDSSGYILIQSGSTVKTELNGVFAAGDVQDKIYRQAVTSAGSGCIAALETINYLKEIS